MEQLYVKLQEHKLIEEFGFIILDERFRIEKSEFESRFGDVADNPTYEKLIGPHTFMWGDPLEEVTYTGEQLGYKKYFDEWKVKGIII